MKDKAGEIIIGTTFAVGILAGMLIYHLKLKYECKKFWENAHVDIDIE